MKDSTKGILEQDTELKVLDSCYMCRRLINYVDKRNRPTHCPRCGKAIVGRSGPRN